jgi:hypothetical protein
MMSIKCCATEDSTTRKAIKNYYKLVRKTPLLWGRVSTNKKNQFEWRQKMIFYKVFIRNQIYVIFWNIATSKRYLSLRLVSLLLQSYFPSLKYDNWAKPSPKNLCFHLLNRTVVALLWYS